jgi:SAM-dependent methyltransferase
MLGPMPHDHHDAPAHDDGGHGHDSGHDHGSTIGDQVTEAWVTTLEVNAAFDRGWLDAAVAWLAGDGRRGAAPAAPVAPVAVVDVGSGAGGAACAFARALDGAVLALDRDPRLIALAQRRAAAEGVAERIGWALAEIGGLPLPRGSAGLVWASGVVHHVPDQQAAVTELAGLLAPGGTLALVEGGLPMRCLPHEIGIGRPGLEARIDEARARWFDELRAELAGPPLPYGWPAALARAGLTGIRTRSFLAEKGAPLDDVGRRIARQHFSSALAELGERLDEDDRATLRRLVDPDDPASVAGRDDITVVAARTVFAADRRAG